MEAHIPNFFYIESIDNFISSLESTENISTQR